MLLNGMGLTVAVGFGLSRNHPSSPFTRHIRFAPTKEITFVEEEMGSLMTGWLETCRGYRISYPLLFLFSWADGSSN